MNEQGAAGQHIRDTLVNSATVGALIADRIYQGSAPRGSTYPLVVFAPQAGKDRAAAGGERMSVRTRWLIVVVCEENSVVLARRIASVVDAALAGTTATVPLDGQDYYVQSVRRQEPFERSGPKDGKTYINAGGYYQTTAYSVP
jgi:hypothetical protein